MSNPLLEIHGDGGGRFRGWLKEIGLEDDFFQQYPIDKLMEWKWLQPQFRVVFPEVFYTEDRPNDPELPKQVSGGSLALNRLYDSVWRIDTENESLWFLHPFFRPDDEAGLLLHEHSAAKGLAAVPENIQHPNGRTIRPFTDYYFHWQAYALLDAIRRVDCYKVILLDTPDATERANRLVRLTEWDVFDRRTNIALNPQWSKLAIPMTWLSHYRAMGDAIDMHEMRVHPNKGMKKRAAIALADFLGIDASRLEACVKDDLLTLAQDWKWAMERKSNWVSGAWSSLQLDIYSAVEWLCYLTGNYIEYYLDLWKYSHMGQDSWAELHAVLPLEFFQIEIIFCK